MKHVRQRLHQEAVRLSGPGRPSPGLPPLPLPAPRSSGSGLQPPEEPADPPPRPGEERRDEPPTSIQVLAQSSFPTGIFARTKITPENLVQTLRLEEAPQLPPPADKGPEEKKTKSKKEKMKERRDRWLSKISSIKQAKEKQAAEAQRKATPVVGDMRPLADALPELCQLIAPNANTAPTARRKSRKNKAPMKRPEPSDFSQMKQTQKRKLLESESGRFCDSVKLLSTKTNPLLDIGEQLRKRMRQEEEQGPS